MCTKFSDVIARFIRAVYASPVGSVSEAQWIPRLNPGIPVIFVLMFSATMPASAEDIPTNTAVLRALDKVTARVMTLEVPVGTPVSFGRLEILAKTCMTRPPEEPPESSVLLVVDKSVGETKTRIFEGWMFASSPDLSAMDDPVYDLWVLACVNKTDSKAP